MGRITTFARHALQGCGLDVEKHSRNYAARRSRILARLGVSAVIDVGAAVGEYAIELRKEGFKGRILSIEPVASSYALLAKRCARDGMWDCLNVALGGEHGSCQINVAANLVSSSILPIGSLHLNAEPQSKYLAVETVEMRRLDDVAEEYGLLEEILALKLDVQGYELEVLGGGERALQAASVVETEVSLVELYQGQPLIVDVISYMAERGFGPAGLRQGFVNTKTDEALQADILFVRER